MVTEMGFPRLTALNLDSGCQGGIFHMGSCTFKSPDLHLHYILHNDRLVSAHSPIAATWKEIKLYSFRCISG